MTLSICTPTPYRIVDGSLFRILEHTISSFNDLSGSQGVSSLITRAASGSLPTFFSALSSVTYALSSIKTPPRSPIPWEYGIYNVPLSGTFYIVLFVARVSPLVSPLGL